MAVLFYEAVFFVSLVLSLAYAYMWHKHFDVHFTLIFIFIPLSNLGYVLLSRAHSLESALYANRMIYLGGCYLIVFIMFSIFNMCNINIPKSVRLLMFLLSSLIYLSVLTTGIKKYFYKYVSFKRENGCGILYNKQYGFMHTVFLIMIIACSVVSIAALIYSYKNKKDVSRKMIYLLLATELVSTSSYFIQKLLPSDTELVPLTYVLSQAIYIIIIYRINLYDITDSGIDSLVQTGNTGFISFDFRFNYLGSNKTAKRVFPELRELVVDKPVSICQKMNDTVLVWLKDFSEDESINEAHYRQGSKYYLVNINYLFDGRRKRGYQFFLTDDTKNQQYISLLNNFNDDLKVQVAEKTKNIVEMHDRLIVSMAAMVESRDNSTGGHIKRTSEGVRILIDEIKKNNTLGLDDEFCRDIIKAAPMHDLGKIAVDDAILRKPGRFTPEEFEKMKSHAAEGAKIVHEILDGTDDIRFHIIAENVAHYHHERWDGSGYPDGLSGEQIPIEARIMAIADVYDALVSKRVYKEKMSFEQADSIILDGMGKHFDKSLEPFYISARPKLEEYYSSLE